MNQVRIGLIGCGNFGESHLQAFRAVPGTEIAAFDTDRNRAFRIAHQFGISRVCDSIEEICRVPELSAIDLVTPEHTHLEPVRTALACGKHVFVEKPLATDLAECDAMIAASQAAARFLMVGHILRFETKYAKLLPTGWVRPFRCMRAVTGRRVCYRYTAAHTRRSRTASMTWI